MGFFDHLHKNGSTAIKPQGSQIRKEIVKIPSQPGVLKRNPSVTVSASQRSSVPIRSNGASKRAVLETKRTSLKPRNNMRKRPSPALQRLVSSSEESDNSESTETSRKRVRRSTSSEPDLKRRICSIPAFAEDNDDGLSFIHAEEIASLDKPTKFIPAFEISSEILLKYPGAAQTERWVHHAINPMAITTNVLGRYQLVTPREHDDFKPLEDIIQVIDSVVRYYLSKAESQSFTNDSTGLQRRLKRAISKRSEQEFRNTVEQYNETINTMRSDGSISKNLDGVHSLSLPLVERILTQTYSRTVSPRVTSLRQYENGTDNVYGELLPRFISKIFKDTKLKSDHVFVDLGSGVGNVVLQAALEIGCESWGCEKMPGPCDVAELQKNEFVARCRLWGLAIGDIHLERDNFLTNENIGRVLKKADVVLVNNQAFTPKLNDELMSLFLDLKEGCQIVSLKSFVPSGHQITPRNINSPVNLLEVETKQYWSKCVSWTDAAGTYCVARKDSTKLRKFAVSRRK
ncbi:MAG: Nucleosomal histone H3-Lys79 methylase [Pycnora praestabilis]|nr:MAG: Nucleosomal histone H3-Lys79 methylase [Pycnora praestabilis]